MQSEGNAAFIGGVVEGRLHTGGGRQGKTSIFTIRGDDDVLYRTEYFEIVSYGHRSLRPGDRVRFTPKTYLNAGYAESVLQMNEPTVEVLYTDNLNPFVPPGSSLESLG